MADYGKTKSFLLIPEKEFNKINENRPNTESNSISNDKKNMLDLFANLKNREQYNTKGNKFTDQKSISDLFNDLKRHEMVDDRFKQIINSEDLPDALKLSLYSKFQNMDKNDNILSLQSFVANEKETQTKETSTKSKSSLPILNINKLSKEGRDLAVDVMDNLEGNGVIKIKNGIIEIDDASIPVKDFIQIFFVRGSLISPKHERFVSKIIYHIDPNKVLNARAKKIIEQLNTFNSTFETTHDNHNVLDESPNLDSSPKRKGEIKSPSKTFENSRGAGKIKRLKRWTKYM